MNQTKAPAPLQLQGQDDEIDLLALLGILLDYKWFIAFVTAVFAMFGLVYVILASPVYRADALIQIEAKKATMPGLEDLAELTGKEPEAVTEIELLKSRWVIGKAVDSLQLDVYAVPHRFPYIGNFFARRFSPETEGEVASPLLPFADEYDWGGSDIHITRLEVPESLVGENMLLVVGEGGRYSVQDADEVTLLEGKVGEQASGQGINLLVDTLVARPGQHFSIGRSTRLSTIDSFRSAIAVSERGRNTGIISMSLEDTDPDFAKAVLDEVARQYVKQNIERTAEEAATSLTFLRDQLPAVKNEMERAAAALNAYQISSKSVDITTETKGVLEQIVDLDTNISNLKLKQMELDKRFTREHPAYQTLLRQMGELEGKKAELEGRVSGLPETQQELLKLTRDVQVSTELYTLLLNKSQELDIIRAGTVGNARIIDLAEVDTSDPVKPKKLLMLLLATAMGGVIGVVLTGLHVALTRGIENPDDIESLGLPVNATIPFSALQLEAEKIGEKTGTMPLLALTHPTDPAVEAIRSLRTSLHFTMMDAPNNIMTITGPSPEVGKTFISANLAVTMAQAGKKVLLIDADMRKGYMQRFFGLESGHAGLSSLLQKQAALEQCMVATSVPGLHFIPRGPIPENPSELLLNPLFAQLLQHASNEFDIVIVDTPPILAVADALIVSKLAGANYIVARFSKNPLGEVQATIKRFETNGVRLNGAVLNATQKRSLAYYGYQKYGYGNYQYSYYGVEQKKGRSKKKG